MRDSLAGISVTILINSVGSGGLCYNIRTQWSRRSKRYRITLGYVCGCFRRFSVLHSVVVSYVVQEEINYKKKEKQCKG